MISKVWQKIRLWRTSNPEGSQRAGSKTLNVPRSTFQYHDKKLKEESDDVAAQFWRSVEGQAFIKRLIVDSIYTFVIKGGVGSGRIEEFMERLQLGPYAGISESSIYRMVKEVEASILWYKELQERGIAEAAREQGQELKVVLGLDETWLDEMLLVCQDLSSGYLFLKSQAQKETRRVGGRK
jgi:hypothetical protein